MSTLSIDNDELKANLAVILGISRDDDDWDATTSADVDRIIRSGRRKFFAAHAWRHLEEYYVIVTPEEFDDGTVAATDGVVTLTGGTWPSDITYYRFVPQDADGTATGVYSIASRDSDTQITLEDTSVDLDASTAYDCYQVDFDLPSNFAAFIDPLTIENSNDWELHEVASLPEWTIRAVGGRSRLKRDRPESFSVFQRVTDETGDFAPYITLWPVPDQQYTLKTKIRIEPGDSLSESGDVCHPIFSELMQEAILSAAENLYSDGGLKTHTQNFQAWLPRFIERDKRMRGTRRLAPRDRRDSRNDPLYHLKTAIVTFETD